MPAVFKLGTFCILSKSNISIVTVVCNLYYHFAKPSHMYSNCIYVYWTTFLYDIEKMLIAIVYICTTTIKFE